MNVLIPIGGLGERFARHGFRFPKPLVNIVGRPMVFWLLDNLSLQPGDRVTIIVDEAVDANFGMVDRIRLEYAREPWELRAVLLPYHTRGAAETVFVALQGMSADELSRRTISLDCDTIYFSDVLATFRAAPAGSSACFCFEDHGDKPMFSYIEVDGKARVTAIREKIKISTVANTGAYAFATGELLRRHCQSVIDSSCGASGELYISSAIRSMLEEGAVVEAVHVERFACVGTPAQLAQFLALIADGTVASRRIRVVFDLDNTLVTAPRTPGDYSTCEPKERNINLLRSLHAAGHYVIIWTARRMRTHGGNVGAIVRDVGLVTMSSLQLFGIPYDELHFGKPHADIYVDDLAVNALVDTEKEVGWAPQPPRSGLLPSRPHNCVVELDGSVVKSSTPDRLRGELAFYRAIPSELQLLFPKLLSVEVCYLFIYFYLQHYFTTSKPTGNTKPVLLCARARARRAADAPAGVTGPHARGTASGVARPVGAAQLLSARPADECVRKLCAQGCKTVCGERVRLREDARRGSSV